MVKIIKIKNLTKGYLEVAVGGNKKIHFNHNDPTDNQILEITEGEFRNIPTIFFSCGYLGIVPSLDIIKNDNKMEVFSTYRDSKFTLTNLFDVCNRTLAINLDSEFNLIVSRCGMGYLLINNFVRNFENTSFKIDDLQSNNSFECITVEPKNRFRKKWFSDESAPLAGNYYFKL